MFLNRNITMHRYSVAICFEFQRMINGILECVFISLSDFLINYLINYLSIIKIIHDIVPRAVNAYKDKYPPPQLEQINTTIEHNRISLFDNVSKVRSIAVAIVSQNANSAVRFLLCKILDSEVNYAK